MNRGGGGPFDRDELEGGMSRLWEFVRISGDAALLVDANG